MDKNSSKKKARARKKRKRQIMRNRLIRLAVLIVAIGLLVWRIFFAGKKEDDSGSESRSSSSVSSDTVPRSSALPDKPRETEYTVLVNSRHPLTEDYQVDTREIPGTEGKLFDARVIDKLERMLDDARRAGYPLYVVSTYRTIEYQKGLYSREVQQYLDQGYDQEAAEKEAARWVAIPGTSEHNLGLTADIVSSTWYNDHSDLTEEFENTEHFKWLYEHCAEYGFILRYPKDKEDVTGIVYEPWHYRYVGEEVAKYIMENNLTLEEFLEG